MLGWRMSVRMNESQYSYDAASEGPSEDPRFLRVKPGSQYNVNVTLRQEVIQFSMGLSQDCRWN